MSDLERLKKPIDRRKLAQLIRHIEEGEEFSYYTKEITAHTIGITGAGGAGKSTLISKLIQAYRDKGNKVAVVATDPSSPFSGGAILGDRIRMQRFATDSNVFIKSVASRGKLGGIAMPTGAIAAALSEAGYDPIIIETLGTGQDEVDISRLVNTAIVVFSPETGDKIQAMKAGIMEIGDIFVVNKSDLSKADIAVSRLTQEISESNRDVKVIKTVATTSEGVNNLMDMIENHLKFLDSHGNRKKTAVSRIEPIIKDKIYNYIKTSIQKKGRWKDVIESMVKTGDISEILKKLL